MDLTGRVAMITGGKRIGAVVARRVAEAGADVAVVYNRSQNEADETVAAIRALGRRGVALQADVSEVKACERVVATTAAELGRLDVLVNMASIYRSKAFDETGPDDWDRQMAVDLRASFLCARAAVPYMRQQGGGRIINFADWVAVSGRPRYLGYVPYYVAKAGVIALTEVLALELAESNILVNAIAPGPIVAPPDTTEDEAEAVRKATPLGRWGGEEEIAKAVLFLVESDFMTGETIRVDGGRHVR